PNSEDKLHVSAPPAPVGKRGWPYLIAAALHLLLSGCLAPAEPFPNESEFVPNPATASPGSAPLALAGRNLQRLINNHSVQALQYERQAHSKLSRFESL